jgi:hypothetical protein
MGVLAKIRKRQLFPVELPNGETIMIRSLTLGENTLIGQLTGNARIGFMIGCVLLEDDGSQVEVRGEKETPEQFGNRIAENCELDAPSLLAVNDAILKLQKTPSASVLAKNSEETSTQG